MAEMIAKVVQEGDSVENSRVELSNGETTLSGKVAAESHNEILVDWEDGVRSVENKSDYELVITAADSSIGYDSSPKLVSYYNNLTETGEGTKLDSHMRDMLSAGRACACGGRSGADGKCGSCGNAVPASAETHSLLDWIHPAYLKPEGYIRPEGSKTAQENPAQPAGWAVAPMDDNAHPGGELMELEMQKRQDTAAWEDSQNRAPVDGENPAQPGGFAVPPASGQPIPGQGADGLAMKANVYAEDVTGEDGVVELQNGNVRMAGRVVASDDDSFIVEWEDERRTIENKGDYNLLLIEHDDEE